MKLSFNCIDDGVNAVPERFERHFLPRRVLPAGSCFSGGFAFFTLHEQTPFPLLLHPHYIVIGDPLKTCLRIIGREAENSFEISGQNITPYAKGCFSQPIGQYPKWVPQ